MALNREDFNFGNDLSEKFPELSRSLREFFSEIARNLNRRSEFVLKSQAPSGTPEASGDIPSTVDTEYLDGTLWIVQNSTVGPITNEVYVKTQTIISGGVKTALWSRIR